MAWNVERHARRMRSVEAAVGRMKAVKGFVLGAALLLGSITGCSDTINAGFVRSGGSVTAYIDPCRTDFHKFTRLDVYYERDVNDDDLSQERMWSVRSLGGSVDLQAVVYGVTPVGMRAEHAPVKLPGAGYLMWVYGAPGEDDLPEDMPIGDVRSGSIIKTDGHIMRGVEWTQCD